MNVAVQTVPGQIVNVDLDMEDGILVYEVFIMTQNNKIFEVEVHARTGSIIKIEQENDFDFD
ncbi:PepSY domain-containing protein [Psychrobacillus sp. BM2]|uniref:PepSY domain-containing protein n=1 Tax=Psychrobacillus sp. BM2 TaxID=3400421 RepID=UPI003B01BA04